MTMPGACIAVVEVSGQESSSTRVYPDPLEAHALLDLDVSVTALGQHVVM
jgi:hypothetical protein